MVRACSLSRILFPRASVLNKIEGSILNIEKYIPSYVFMVLFLQIKEIENKV